MPVLSETKLNPSSFSVTVPPLAVHDSETSPRTDEVLTTRLVVSLGLILSFSTVTPSLSSNTGSPSVMVTSGPHKTHNPATPRKSLNLHKFYHHLGNLSRGYVKNCEKNRVGPHFMFKGRGNFDRSYL